MTAQQGGDWDAERFRRLHLITALREATEELFGLPTWAMIYKNAVEKLELKTVQKETDANGWET